ncbi:MAG: sulfonate transport system substrate-binding protein [Marivirga sp.]|jgi:sulfonate transport system substrate-binding protein
MLAVKLVCLCSKSINRNLDEIRLGGVPEHFNLPIHLALEEKAFQEDGVNVKWTDFDGGTGQMTEALRNNDIDVCVLLTEGIVSDILKGNKSKIISGYVKSPLTWGIHSGVENTLDKHREIYDKQYAISRLGSGSHLMAIVDALDKDVHLKEEQFTIVNNLNGALDSLNRLDTDVFYWEKFTTKPYVVKGDLKKIGEFVTPWPCFMMAASEQVLAEKPKVVSKMLRIINKTCAQFMEKENAIDLVSQRYGIDAKDAAKWYHATEWATDGWVSNKMLKNVVYTLKEAGIIPEIVDTNHLIWQRNRI